MPEIDFKRYTEYLKELSESFESRFKDFQNYKKAFCFASSPKHVEISHIEEIAKLFDENVSEAKSEFLEIKSAYDCFDIDPITSLKSKRSLKNIYAKILSMFADSYNCESSFSKLNFILNKYRSRMTQENVKFNLLISTTNFNVNCSKLLKNCQISH